MPYLSNNKRRRRITARLHELAFDLKHYSTTIAETVWTELLYL